MSYKLFRFELNINECHLFFFNGNMYIYIMVLILFKANLDDDHLAWSINILSCYQIFG